ncbi:MAG TPA: hypothetical protein VE053_11190 [Allosphingosinicella sp.]|nr:hypothetical protein [Allosphingosinicella sp.]
MFEKQKTRLGHFLEKHEKAFRTEIILIPALVLSFKFFQEYIDKANSLLQIIYVITVALLCYFLALAFVAIGGDILLRRLAFGLNPAYKLRGVYVQITGAPGREFAVSRIFLNFITGEYIYRGIAYDSDLCQVAAWQVTLSNTEVIDDDLALYFAGKSIIKKQLNFYEYPLLKNQVFSILYFTGHSQFRGAGFDFRRQGTVDYRSSFPIAGMRVDNQFLKSRGISSKLLVDVFHISDQDRRAIKTFAENLKALGTAA